MIDGGIYDHDGTKLYGSGRRVDPLSDDDDDDDPDELEPDDTND